MIRYTPYGKREILIIWLAAVLLGTALLFVWPDATPWTQVGALALGFIITLFFRDPQRDIPDDINILLAPADGKITDIGPADEQEFLHEPAIRIGIFLSVLDVHINRAPCTGKVAYLQHHPGKCINALSWKAASEKNEAMSMGLNCLDHPAAKVLVKQITGAIARRIVCSSRMGQTISSGERYGMIKFGSRTELYFPTSDVAEIAVKVGDTVRAGETILVHYTQPAGVTVDI
ncbi:MAG: phosphatidylserine decarboxylase family protein [Sedimentisphaerales bacterium]|nr:phosphatidylserine decarboxylase family protein [Sedimentisphaerales bacterium]